MAIDFALAPVVEIAIVGRTGEAATWALLQPAFAGFRPNQVVALAADPARSTVELMRDRVRIDDRPTAYVCRNFACRLPVTDPAALAAQLAEIG